MKEIVKQSGKRQRVYTIETWILGSYAYAVVKQRKRDGGFKTFETFTADTSSKRLDEAVAEVEKMAEDFVATL